MNTCFERFHWLCFDHVAKSLSNQEKVHAPSFLLWSVACPSSVVVGAVVAGSKQKHFLGQAQEINWPHQMASSQDAWYLSLLGLAEHFRVSTPPNIRLCVQCLQTVFNFKPPPRVEARTHLQLGNILVQYTKNVDLARSHLEQAVSYLLNAYLLIHFQVPNLTLPSSCIVVPLTKHNWFR